MQHFCFIFIIFLITIRSSMAMIPNDYILFISSYTSDYPWSKNIEDSFRQHFIQQNINLSVYSEYMNTDILPASNRNSTRMEGILTNYAQHPPRIVILLSDEAWLAYRANYSGQWGKVSVILAGIKDISPDIEKYAQKTNLQPGDFIPSQQLCRQYNATGITESLQVEATIKLMQQLHPDMQAIAMIGDQQFYGTYSNLQVQQYIQEKRPDLQLITLDGRFITTDSLYHTLSTLPQHTGILLSCWLQDSKTHLYDRQQIIENICHLANRPVYVLNDWGNYNDYFMGGFYSCSHEYGNKLAEITLRLIQGEQASDIPLESNQQGLGIYLNQTLLQQYGLDASSLPAELVTYYAQRPNFWQRHSLLLIICSILVGIGIIIYLIVFTSLRFTFYRRKLDTTQNEIDISLNNQQHLADAVRSFLDATTEKESVNKILERLLRELKADRAYIFEFDDLKHISNNTYEICSSHVSPQIDNLQNIPNESIPWLYNRIEENKLLIIENLHSMQGIIPEEELNLLLDQGIFSLIITSLQVNDKLWGYVGVDYVREIKHWNQQELVYFNTLAQIICIGIEHFRSEKRNMLSQQKVAQLESLFSFASVEASVGVAQWNPLTQQGFATDQWFINLGETTREINEVINTYQYMHPEDQADFKQFIHKASQGEEQSFVKNIRIFQNKGWHWYKYHATLKNYQPEQQNIELVFLSADIDNLKKIETDLTAAKAQAEESDKLKSAFIANMSHEIRTPLNAIVGFSNLLADDQHLSQEERSEYMRIIQTNNQLLLQLINDILDISKIEAGVMSFSEDVINLNHFCKEIEAIYTLRTSQKVEIKFLQNYKEEYSIHLDRTRLNQVISNFLNNALKFTTKGHIYFSYQIREKDIFFYVEDTGIGIPIGKHAEIFHRFVKLNNFAQGTGLGLSICATIIQKFGGNIGVDSVPDEGATFWFTIPRQDI